MPDTLNPESLRLAADAFAASTYAHQSQTIAFERGLRAYLAAEAARGWAMRPRVATGDMSQAALTSIYDEARPMWELIWTAMWDAATPEDKP